MPHAKRPENVSGAVIDSTGRYNSRAAPSSGIARDHGVDLEGFIAKLRDSEFPEQRAFVDDPSRQKAAVCSRRAGKTRASAHQMLKDAVKYGEAMSAYVALTRKSAKRIMWRELKRIEWQFKVGMHFDNQDLICTLPNGHSICLFGANRDEDIERLRGSPWLNVVIDECQSFGGHIRELIDEVLAPALMDFNGAIAMIGTPNAACDGFFYNVTTGKHKREEDRVAKWPTYSWTCFNNPYLMGHRHENGLKGWLKEFVLAKRGWDWETPAFQREYLGRWVGSDDEKIYKFSWDRNTYEGELDNAIGWMHGIGVDLGFDNATAFSVSAFAPEESPNFYIVQVFTERGMTVDQVAEELKRLIAKYRPVYIMVDQGGLGKMIGNDLRERFHIPCEQAAKRFKFDAIELFNSDLLAGKIQAHKVLADEWIEEARLAQWDPRKRGKEDRRFSDDTLDSVLYNYRQARHYLYQAPEPRPEFGSQKYYQQIDKKIIAEMERQIIEDRYEESLI